VHWLAALVLVALPAGADDDRRVVRLHATPADDAVLAVPTVDELDDGDVLVVQLTDGVPDAAGAVRQCLVTATGFSRCANPFPVRFDGDGAATFQYQLADPGGCDGGAACAVVVSDDAGERIAYAFTVFGGPAPAPPTVRLAPPGRYEPGDDAGLDVSGLPPGGRVRAAFCTESCGPTSSTTADGAGNARLRVTLGDRGADARIVVVAGASSSVLDVPFAPPPSANYDGPRLVAGLAAAAVFLLAAVRLVVTTDWRPPSEAQVPDVD
jgi:hypothetical protein